MFVSLSVFLQQLYWAGCPCVTALLVVFHNVFINLTLFLNQTVRSRCRPTFEAFLKSLVRGRQAPNETDSWSLKRRRSTNAKLSF
jgi:hypothetical protein